MTEKNIEIKTTKEGVASLLDKADDILRAVNNLNVAGNADEVLKALGDKGLSGVQMEALTSRLESIESALGSMSGPAEGNPIVTEAYLEQWANGIVNRITSHISSHVTAYLVDANRQNRIPQMESQIASIIKDGVKLNSAALPNITEKIDSLHAKINESVVCDSGFKDFMTGFITDEVVRLLRSELVSKMQEKQDTIIGIWEDVKRELDIVGEANAGTSNKVTVLDGRVQAMHEDVAKSQYTLMEGQHSNRDKVNALVSLYLESWSLVEKLPDWLDELGRKVTNETQAIYRQNDQWIRQQLSNHEKSSKWKDILLDACPKPVKDGVEEVTKSDTESDGVKGLKLYCYLPKGSEPPAKPDAVYILDRGPDRLPGFYIPNQSRLWNTLHKTSDDSCDVYAMCLKYDSSQPRHEFLMEETLHHFEGWPAEIIGTINKVPGPESVSVEASTEIVSGADRDAEWLNGLDDRMKATAYDFQCGNAKEMRTVRMLYRCVDINIKTHPAVPVFGRFTDNLDDFVRTRIHMNGWCHTMTEALANNSREAGQWQFWCLEVHFNSNNKIIGVYAPMRCDADGKPIEQQATLGASADAAVDWKKTLKIYISVRQDMLIDHVPLPKVDSKLSYATYADQKVSRSYLDSYWCYHLDQASGKYKDHVTCWSELRFNSKGEFLHFITPKRWHDE